MKSFLKSIEREKKKKNRFGLCLSMRLFPEGCKNTINEKRRLNVLYMRYGMIFSSQISIRSLTKEQKQKQIPIRFFNIIIPFSTIFLLTNNISYPYIVFFFFPKIMHRLSEITLPLPFDISFSFHKDLKNELLCKQGIYIH